MSEEPLITDEWLNSPFGKASMDALVREFGPKTDMRKNLTDAVEELRGLADDLEGLVVRHDEDQLDGDKGRTLYVVPTRPHGADDGAVPGELLRPYPVSAAEWERREDVLATVLRELPNVRKRLTAVQDEFAARRRVAPHAEE